MKRLGWFLNGFFFGFVVLGTFETKSLMYFSISLLLNTIYFVFCYGYFFEEKWKVKVKRKKESKSSEIK